ncbi:hypothetical protein D3C77_468750 [compost metagenome]
MFGPDGEVVGIEGEFLLQILDDGGVLEEQHSPETGAEAAVYLGFALGIGLWRHNLFQFSFDDVPQLVVLLAKQDDGTGALGVEGGGAVLDGILDEGRQLGLGMGHLVTQGIDGTTYFDLFDKRTAHNISLVDESLLPALPTKVIWLRFLESWTITPSVQETVNAG